MIPILDMVTHVAHAWRKNIQFVTAIELILDDNCRAFNKFDSSHKLDIFPSCVRNMLWVTISNIGIMDPYFFYSKYIFLAIWIQFNFPFLVILSISRLNPNHIRENYSYNISTMSGSSTIRLDSIKSHSAQWRKSIYN